MGEVQGPASSSGTGGTIAAAAAAIGAAAAKAKTKPAPAAPASLDTKDKQKTSATHATPAVSVGFDPLSALAGVAEDLAIVVVKTADALRKELAKVSSPPTPKQKERIEALLTLSESNLATAEARAADKGANQAGRSTDKVAKALQKLGAGYRTLHKQLIESIRKEIKSDKLATPSRATQLDASLQLMQQQVARDSWSLPDADREKLWKGVSKELQRQPTDSAELFK